MSLSRPISDHEERMRVLRRKRVWTARDLSEFLGGDWNPRRARDMAKRWDEESGGKLLEESAGLNRRFTFLPANLRKLRPELFEGLEELEERVSALEEGLGDAHARIKRLGAQTVQNSRDLSAIGEQLQLFRKAS